MTPTIDTITNHISCRDFDAAYRLTESKIQQIIQAAKRAPSWSNQQMFSMVVVDDKQKKQQLGDYLLKQYGHESQAAIWYNSSVVLVFLVDFYKVAVALEQEQQANFADVTDALEPLLVSATDLALAAENAALAAESLGLGTVMLGYVRQMQGQLIDSLKLPAHTLPFLGLAIGKATKMNKLRPRLPTEFNIFFNEYDTAAVSVEAMQQYSEELIKSRQYNQATDPLVKVWLDSLKNTYRQHNFPAETLNILQQQKIIK